MPAGGSLSGLPPGPSCNDGVVKDDGSVETGWGWVPTATSGQYVQEFHSAEFPTRTLDRLCLCFLRTRQDADLDFELVFYRDTEGQPEPLPFAVVPGQALGLPDGIAGATFVEVDLPEIEVPIGTFYVGPRWNPGVDQFFFLCADTTPTTPRTDLWFIDDRAEGWDSALTTIDPLFAAHRAVMIRPVSFQGNAVDVPIGNLSTSFLALLLIVAAWVALRRP